MPQCVPMWVAVALLLLVACGGPPAPHCELLLATIGGVPIACNCPDTCDRGCSTAICDRFGR